MKKSIYILLHILIGILIQNPVLAKTYGITVLCIAFSVVIAKKNKNEEVFLWSFYLVGVEVLLRMSKGLLFYEFGKYSVMLILILGLVLRKYHNKNSKIYLYYLLLLVIGIAFTPYLDLEKIRQEVSFNLSGPFLLGIGSLYFFSKELTIDKLLDGLKMFILPLVAMLSFLFFTTPNVSEIVFKSAANFDTTAGFGPNQVSTVLGFSIFIFFIFFIFRYSLTNFLFLDLILFFYLVYRALLTFSRGGILASIFAIVICTLYLSRYRSFRIGKLLKYLSVAIVFMGLLFFYTSSVTDGVLTKRYLNKTTYGEDKEDITSGRTGYIDLELKAFYENPFFGVGVGGSKYYRDTHSDRFVGSSHNEITRLLSEHGIIGFFVFIMLLTTPIKRMRGESLMVKGILLSFYTFWFLTINHSAMRIAFSGFIYSLSLVSLVQPNEKNIIYRK